MKKRKLCISALGTSQVRRSIGVSKDGPPHHDYSYTWFMLSCAGGMERLTIFSDMTVFSLYAMQVMMVFAMMTVLLVMLPGDDVCPPYQ
ncbi:MAG: hypothetical protein ACI3XP_05325 [Eubacteriales bacterium]